MWKGTGDFWTVTWRIVGDPATFNGEPINARGERRDPIRHVDEVIYGLTIRMQIGRDGAGSRRADVAPPHCRKCDGDPHAGKPPARASLVRRAYGSTNITPLFQYINGFCVSPSICTSTAK